MFLKTTEKVIQEKAFDQKKKKPGLKTAFEQLGPGVRFSKVPVTFRARHQIFKSKYKE